MLLNPEHVQRLYELNYLQTKVNTANDIAWIWAACLMITLGFVAMFIASKSNGVPTDELGALLFIMGGLLPLVVGISVLMSCIIDWNGNVLNPRARAWEATRENLRAEARATVDPQVP